MPVPFIDLSRLTKELRNDVLASWTEAYDKTEFVGGPKVAAVEKTLAAQLGVPRAVTCANGTDALLLALEVAGVKAGDKVALPNLTFWATYEAVVRMGATPVLVDVDEADLQLSLDALKSAHDAHRFSAAMLVHLYGWTSARLAEIRAFCKERDIRLVEDGAQCYGVEVGGRPVLADAEVSTTSFYPAKVIGGAMDGGAVFVRDEAAEKLVRSLANHGRSDHYAYAHVGWNSRMGGVQARFLEKVLEKTDVILGSRRKAAALYRELLGAKKGLRLWGPPAGVTENGYLTALTVDGKSGAQVGEALKAKGIGFARTYPEPMDAQPPAKGVALAHGDLKVSRAICANVVNLPLFYGITDAEVRESAEALLSVVG